MKLNWIPTLVVLPAVILLAGACRKNSPITKPAYPANAYALPVTAAEKELVKNLEQITGIFKEIYRDAEALTEVNAAIASGVYLDECILLKDLVCPANSRLKGNLAFREIEKKGAFRFGHFSSKFWEGVKKRDDPGLIRFLEVFTRDNGLHRTAESRESAASQIPDPLQISIYFPYHTEFLSLTGREAALAPTLVCATADADEGTGYQPVYDGTALSRYKEILVSDEYAMNHPTHIIGINGTEPVFRQALRLGAGDEAARTGASALGRQVKQVFINDVRCRKQYDALISFTGNGGGAEIRFTRGDGFLKQQDGQVQPADIYMIGEHTSISRKDIKNANWVNYGLVWDEDWELNNTQQFLAIFEEDNRNEWNLDFGVKTTVKKIEDVNVDGNIDGSLRFKSDDFVIRQTNYNYDVFFAMNRMNPEGEMYNGWPVRDKNALLSFTFADQTLD